MSTIKTNTLQNVAGSKSVPVDTVVDGSAKAWVNFNGTGTVAVRASFNVSSITDNGTGDYTVNFTTAMPDANYSAPTTPFAAGASTTSVEGVSQAASGLRFRTYSAGSQTDFANVHCSFFR